MRTIDILKRNNVKVSGKDADYAPTLVFAHGFGCDQHMWRFVAPAFEDDYGIVLFDYVGCGKSEMRAYDPLRYRTLDGYAQDVIDVCGALGLEHAIFVGHSVSSMIGVLASIRQPDLFDHLIMIAPSPCYINDAPDYAGGFDRAELTGMVDMMERDYVGWANVFASVMMKNPDRPELSAELEDSFLSTDPVIARRFAEATFLSDHRLDLPAVTVPSLIVQCADDTIAPLEVGEYMHRAMPDNVLRIMSATGHCPHMSHPAETIAIMKEHLASAGR